MTEPPLPFDPPLPDSHPLAMTEFACKYNEFRQADLEVSPEFAKVCLYVRDNRITKTQLSSILEDSVKMHPWSAKVEATHILHISQEGNAEILQDLSNGKITVSDARKNSTKKAITESASVPSEVSATPAPPTPGQPESAAPAVPKELNRILEQALFDDEERRRNREGQSLMSPEEFAVWNLEVKQKLAAMSPEEREAAAAAIRKAAAAAEVERRAQREKAMRSFHVRPPGSPDPARKENRSEVKHKNPLINNVPLSPEAHAARKEAEETRRAAMTPEAHEAAQAARRKEAGILTPEEQKERQAAAAEREKARIAWMSPAAQARYFADKAKTKKMMAEYNARWAREQAAKKRSSE
jgi:hypothetical protein